MKKDELTTQTPADAKPVLSAVEFLKWCNTPVYRASGELGFRLRVQPQFPEYDSYLVIDATGYSVLPKGKFLSAEELYEYWLNCR